jgi:hypothetical protein
MVVYKYIEKKYLLDFKDKCVIRINTLYNLRSEKKKSIRDEFEGFQRLRVDPKNEPAKFSSEQGRELFPQVHFGEGITKDAITIMPNAHVVSNTEVPDAFVFCASLKLDDQLGKKWNCDAHYRIVDPFQFAEIAFGELNNQVTLRCFKADKVKYTDKEITITNQNKNETLSSISRSFWDICFTKPKQFADEMEFRIVFIPEYPRKIEPILLTSLKLRKCCEF